MGKNRKRFFRYRAFVHAGKKRGFCRLRLCVATPGRSVESDAMRAGLLLGLIGLLAGSAAAAAPGLPPANFNFTRNDSVLVVSPHPDDETLCFAGVMQRALAQGARVSVVWVTGATR